MSPQIGEEVLLLLMSIYGGFVLVLCYDLIRVIRRVFKASMARVIVEDVIFWTVASIFMFNIFLKYNYGRPRYFAVGAALGTMLLFEWLVGRTLVDKMSSFLWKILNILLKPLKKVTNIIKLKGKKIKEFIRKKVNQCHKNKEETQLHQED